jgi:phage terminase large subunit GpA-like protein
LATRLAIEMPGPGYIHFSADPAAGFDQEFFLQLLSERKEKRKRLGVISVRWIQVRERNEGLDLVCMVLCALEMYRGNLDSMEPLVVATDESGKPKPALFGAHKMKMVGAADLDIGGGVAGVHYPKASGYGALPGSGFKF